MIPDLVGTFVAESLIGILVKQSSQQISALGSDGIGFWELKFFVDDVLEHLFLVFLVEGRARVQHLIDENSERPPVNWACVSFPK